VQRIHLTSRDREVTVPQVPPEQLYERSAVENRIVAPGTGR
jgi:hypothetical protein